MKKLITILALVLSIVSCKKDTKKSTVQLKTAIETEEAIKTPLNISKSVAARSGLNFRVAPKGKVISKFKYNAEVIVVEKTGIIEKITDNGQQVTGEWVGVKHNDKVVYVFDAFLTKSKNKPRKKELKNPIDIVVFEGYIIQPGEYHNEEIPDEINTQNWLGIFNDNGNYSVKKTAVTITTVHDAIVDNTGENTGKKITATNPEKCYLLLNNILHLIERSVDTIVTKPFIVHPEKPFSFDFNNNNYSLSATAEEYNSLNPEENLFNAKDYKLYLEKTENGIKTKQLLLFEKFFDDKMIEILFIGDIDGDGIPDLLIDTSNHYNSSIPTLYLSKEVKKGNLLRIVSLHTSVGC